jgi:hypothetical protein
MPIRALFAVGPTLVFSYGSAALVYECGVLNWLGVGSLHTVAGYRSLLWMPPLVSFCMLCGPVPRLRAVFSCCASRTIGG